ncbi:MAG: sialate O-acetylesterase [Candidatus Latescibacterota bacterium]
MMMAENRLLSILEPKPYQVIQRHGFVPGLARAHNPDGPCPGSGDIRISGVIPGSCLTALEVRTVLLPDAFGEPLDWRTLDACWEGENFVARATVPAGGWVRLELRATDADGVVCIGAVAPIGVGEVFLIAGQSYAANCNHARTAIEDPQGRVSAFDPKSQTWRIAHDSQPTIHSTHTGGSIWPSATNGLLPLLRVPIGMVNVAVPATASRQWMPGEALFDDLLQAGLWAGDFRYVLWQQGESDVIEGVDTETYKSRILAIKQALEERWGFSRTWIPAKSTLHPAVYTNPEGERRIRKAIDELWRTSGFLPGPDTDSLVGIGIHRDPIEESGHFTLLGQQRAGGMWCSALRNSLNESGEF